MARRPNKRVVKRRGDYVWTALHLGSTVLSSVHDGEPIVQASDWVTANNTEKATLMSIRGWIALGHTSGNVARATLAIIKHDADQVPTHAGLDPALVTTYVDEDILWTGGSQGVSSSLTVQYHDINVKAKRKLDGDVDISIIHTCSPTDTFVMTLVLRGLLLKGSG